MNLQHAIALTGGIATGKSTIGSLLKIRGFKIIDLDEITHHLLDLHVNKIEQLFGKDYIKDGKVNRANLGNLIFSDKMQKEKLENFIHPLIRKQMQLLSQKLEDLKLPYFIDIPLFFEKEEFYQLKYSVLIYAPKQIQLQRLMKRSNLNHDEALKRINSQMDIEEKRQKASFIVNNSLDLKNLQNQTDALIDWIKEKYENLKI